MKRTFEEILNEIHQDGFSIQQMYELGEGYWTVLIAKTEKRSVNGYAHDYDLIETMEDAWAKARRAWEEFKLKPKEEIKKKVSQPDIPFNVDDLGL